MARRKAAPQTTEVTEQQTDTAVSATETRATEASPLLASPYGGLTDEQLYIGRLAAQLIAPNHHNMAPEHIEARCTEALQKAEVLLVTLKARYSK